MPPPHVRPSAFASANNRRPLSAIFIGSNSGLNLSNGSSMSSLASTPPFSTPSNLPELPEPPRIPDSPSSSFSLPSPPATNSTGSGSGNGSTRATSGGVGAARGLAKLSKSGSSGGASEMRHNRESVELLADEHGRLFTHSNGSRTSIVNGSGSRPVSRSGSVSRTRMAVGSDEEDNVVNFGKVDRLDRGMDADDFDNDDNDEDHTARFAAVANMSANAERDKTGLGRVNSKRLSRGDNSNVSALQRVKSLTQRNRMVLDKLASISSGSRISTPSPARGIKSPDEHTSSNSTHSSSLATRPSLSSIHSSTSASTASSSSSRLTRDRSNSYSGNTHHELSGSETERENVSSVFTASTSASDDSPPLRDSVRQRRISAPGPVSPNKTKFTDRFGQASGSGFAAEERSASRMSRSGSPGTEKGTGRRHGGRRTESMFLTKSDVTSAALSAVANSRRSPPSGKKRQPLPPEFVDPGGGRSALSSHSGESSSSRLLDRSEAGLSPAPFPTRSTPSPSGLNGRPGSTTLSYSSNPSTSSQKNPTHSPQSPRTRRQRFSTVREMTRRYQTRWLSEDLTNTSEDVSRNGDADADDYSHDGASTVGGGRAQKGRGGSAESALSPTAGRSVVGESLRAAGLVKRRSGIPEDLFDLKTPARSRANETGLVRSSAQSDGASTGNRDREPRTPGTQLFTVSGSTSRRVGTIGTSRPSTATGYNDEPRSAVLRTQRSAFPLPSSRERADTLMSLEGAKLALQATPSPTIPPPRHHERLFTSPATIGRSVVLTPLNTNAANNPSLPSSLTNPTSANAPEHSRLMMGALNMFESQLARLPSMGTTTTVTVPELFRSAQMVVQSANSLNSLLRSATGHALNQQIESEVEADNHEDNTNSSANLAMELSEVWRGVGADYRESLRVSDDLVRTMTDFMLGVGKLLRETTSAVSVASQSHGKSISLDESDIGRRSELGSGDRASGSRGGGTEGSRLSSDGRRSEVRRSLQLTGLRDRDLEYERERGGERERPMSRMDLVNSRAASALARRDKDLPKEPLRSDDRDRERERERDRRISRLSLTTRRLFSPRNATSDDRDRPSEQQSPPPFNPSTSIETVHYEPSPTPLSRNQNAEQRGGRSLTAVPPPLSTLPSETLLNRNERSELTRSSTTSVRRPKTASAASVRTNSILPTSIVTSPNPTTAISTTFASASNTTSSDRIGLPTRGDSLTYSFSSSSASSSRHNPSSSASAALQQQYERDGRQRTISANSRASLEETGIRNDNLNGVKSGSETERDTRNRVRISLDGSGASASQTMRSSTGRKERRQTLTDIFSRS